MIDETRPDTRPSRYATGSRGTDVGTLRAAVAHVASMAIVYGTIVFLALFPFVGFSVFGTIGLLAGAFVLIYALLSLKESDYTLYTLRLSIIDAIRTGEWHPPR